MHSVQPPIFFFVSYLLLLASHDINILITGVIASPASSTVVALNDVTLTCTSSSTRPLSYSWHRVDGDVPSHASGHNTSRLTLHNVVPADEGEYYCMASLFGHCAVSDNVMVIVEGTYKEMIYVCKND